MVHMPDTQNYVNNASLASIFTTQTQWMSAQKSQRNIRFAVQVGDLTDDNGTTQWDRAMTSLGELFDEIPIAACTGNHDCGPGGSGQSRESQFILPSRLGVGSAYEQQPTFGGFFHHPNDANGNTQNSWHTFRVGKQDYLVLTCEWGPRNQVLTWMESLVAARPFHRVILVLHSYLESGTKRYDWATSQSGMNPHATDLADDPDGVNDGEEVWTKLVSKYENFCLVCCGHAGRGFRTAVGNHGNVVNEMLYNTQSLSNGGDGWLRLLEFFPDGNTVHARTYSPHLDEWDTGADDDFYFSLSPVSKTDSDLDGMPDYHETQWGFNPASAGDAGADADGDGRTNLHEFVAGTDPKSASSLFTIHSFQRPVTGNAATVTWSSVPGKRYQIQKSTSLGPNAWAALGTPVQAQDTTTSASVTMSGPRCFYRVEVEP